MKLNNLPEAEKLFKQAMEIVEKSFYAGHYNLAPILEHLTDLYVLQEKYADAEPVCVRALDIYDKTLSGEHRLIYETTYKLILIYRKLGKPAEVEKAVTKALKNLDTPLGPAE